MWATTPDWRTGVSAELHEGWLTFEGDGLRRRLAPIPDDWEDASPMTLQSYLARAQAVQSARKRRETDARPDGR